MAGEIVVSTQFIIQKRHHDFESETDSWYDDDTAPHQTYADAERVVLAMMSYYNHCPVYRIITRVVTEKEGKTYRQAGC